MLASHQRGHVGQDKDGAYRCQTGPGRNGNVVLRDNTQGRRRSRKQRNLELGAKNLPAPWTGVKNSDRGNSIQACEGRLNPGKSWSFKYKRKNREPPSSSSCTEPVITDARRNSTPRSSMYGLEALDPHHDSTRQRSLPLL